MDSTAHYMHTLKWLFFTASKKLSKFLLIRKKPKISQILLYLQLIGNRTSCHPIHPEILLMINKSDRARENVP